MRDPIEELENFTVPGPPMDPLPAAEVRRRGNRIRRRNTALAGAAAVAVLAAIVTPVALLAGDGQDDSVQPAPATDWLQRVPEGFALSHELFGDPPVTAKSGADDIVLCGATVWSPADPVATVDLAGARFEENEAFLGRTLALYADDDAAEQALGSLRSGVEDCPRDENGGGLPLVQEQVDPGLGEDSFAFIQRSRDGDLLAELTLWEVVRSGNALYLDTSYGAAGDDQAVATAVSNMTHRSEVVRAQLCVFSADPCATPGVASDAPSPGEGAVPAIPAGLPLAAGLPPGGLDGGVPSPEPSSCGATLAKPDVVETARAQWRSISEIRDRQLMTFAREADAQAYVESVAELYCTVEDLGRGGRRVTETFGGAPVGDFSAIAVSHHTVDGRVDRGLVLTHVVRVGRAVLLAQRVDEGFVWAGAVDPQSRQLADASTDELRPVVDAMCTFTEAGC
jgi:hypothetical protein